MTNQQKLQEKVGGLACSFCAESINKAFARMDGVQQVNVSLAHEEVLIHYDADQLTDSDVKQTLLDLGYTIRDPNKVKAFEEQEQELRTHRNRLLLAAGFTGVAFVVMVAMWLGLMQPWFKYARTRSRTCH